MNSKTTASLLDEIREQSRILQGLLNTWPVRFEVLQPPPGGTRVLLGIAEGSSRHALLIAAPFLEKWTGLLCQICTPEMLEERFAVSQLFSDSRGDLFSDAYFLTVSQSGETASVLRILDALEQERQSPLPLLALTNRQPSALQERFEQHIALEAGEERFIAATKTMTASLMNLLLWGLWLGTRTKTPVAGYEEEILRQLSAVPSLLETLWEKASLSRFYAFSRKMIEVNHFILLSKGLLTLVLPEVGLKLTETSSNIVYTDNSESFKHGPKVMLSGIQEQHPNCVYFVPSQEGDAEVLFKDIQSHFWVDGQRVFQGDRVFFVTSENSATIPDDLLEGLGVHPDKILTLPAATPLQSLFVTLVAFQIISYCLALAKGENPDNPALEKAVTE